MPRSTCTEEQNIYPGQWESCKDGTKAPQNRTAVFGLPLRYMQENYDSQFVWLRRQKWLQELKVASVGSPHLFKAPDVQFEVNEDDGEVLIARC